MERPEPRPIARPRILVLGGTGFIGRHAAAALLEAGADVTIGSRRPDRLRRRVPGLAGDCAALQARLERLQRPEDWRPLIAGFDAVVNCVGILRPRGRETYDRVHHRAPAALAAACAGRGVRLVHVSALGLEGEVRSGFLRSKRDGEQALRRSGADACIVRPSLLDAERGGFGACWLRRVAAWPWHPVPPGASGRIAAMDVRDLGEALARLALRPHLAGRHGPGEFELGGREAMPLRDYLAALRRLDHERPARWIPVPDLLARLASHACDLLHLTPFSFGHWELLQRDNVPARDDLTALLGRAPRPVGAAAVPRPAVAPALETGS